MSVTELPTLNRLSPTFKSDLNTFFGSSLPAFSTQLNAELARIDTIGAGAYSATSTTSLTIGLGEKNLSIDGGKGFVTGQYVSVADSANVANYMRGPVKSYNSGTGALVVSVDSIGGSGTKTVWSVGLQLVASPNIQLDSLVVLTSGTSWICPDGVRKVKLTMSGGGGSGATGGSDAYIGPDGAGGGGVIATFLVTAGQRYVYTIGAGGNAIIGGANIAGNSGASSTFSANGITYTALGGGGGNINGTLAVGGSGTGTGAVIIDGQNGIFTQSVQGISSTLGSGGGMSILGKSGGAGANSTAASIAGLPGKIILELYK